MTDQVQENDRRSRFTVTDPSGQADFIIDFPVTILTDKDGNDYVPLRAYVDGVETENFTFDLASLTVSLNTPADQNSLVVVDGSQLVKRVAGHPLRGGLSSALLNKDANLVIQILQEMHRDIGRALLLNPADDTATISGVLAAAVANAAVIWNSDGTGLTSGPTADEIANAQTYATQAAAHVANLTGTSTTSRTIGTGSKAFTTQSGKSFVPGTWVEIASDADPSNYMHGQVTAYSDTSLTVNVTNIGGSGTLADWTIQVSGTQGAAGNDGDDGADGNSILNGTGAPSGGTGVDGDFYIDTNASEIYGPKSGTWPSAVSLVGPQGAAGADGADGTDGTIYELLHIQDQKTSGTPGGGSSAGANTRVLNTVVTNEITGASLSSNQITLPAGTYEIDATAPSFQSNSNTLSQLYLYNVDDTAVELYGTSLYAALPSGSGINVVSRVRGRFTIAGEKDFELRHYIQNAFATSGLGNAASNGLEVYADVMIRKVT
jgi:hypothetical protein